MSDDRKDDKARRSGSAWQADFAHQKPGSSSSYSISPRPLSLGGGWRMRLIEDGQEVGGGVFPIPEEDPQTGIDWWNALTEQERAHWLLVGATAVPADARRSFLAAEAYVEARNEAEAWLDAKRGR